MLRVCVVICAVLLICGCAGIDIPSPETIISRPLGTDSVKLGMTKDKVKSLWGDPDSISFVTIEKPKREREVWTYDGRYSSLPIDAGYLSKTKKVYFDGINVTGVTD